jgi:hypothetical protein
VGPLPKAKPKTAENEASSKMVEDDIIQEDLDLDPTEVDLTSSTLIAEKNQASQVFSQASQNALQTFQNVFQESQNAFKTTLLAILVTRQEVRIELQCKECDRSSICGHGKL